LSDKIPLAGQNVEALVLDSTYLLPAFGVELDFENSKRIRDTLDELANRGVKIYLSNLSPLECFLKAFSLAEKGKSEEGRKTAKLGLLAVSEDVSMFSSVSYSDEKIVEEATTIRKSHKDPFDCFIFATAKALDAILVTEDDSAPSYLDSGKVLSWKQLKKIFAKGSS
jgi:PIN domain nuclease of toxin-antitoxin system